MVLYELGTGITNVLFMRDIVEILFLTAAIYYVSQWLKKDRHKNLLGYFYGYCLLGIISYAAHLTIVTSLLVATAPVVALLFIVLHQHTLQKNYITLRTAVDHGVQQNNDWLEILMRSALKALNNNKEIICVIEHGNSIADLIQTPIAFNSPMQEELLDLLFESNSFDAKRLLWINSKGIIVGVNACWKTLGDAHWIADDLKELALWKQDALCMTSKLDTLICRVNPSKRAFDIVVQGRCFDDVTAAQAVTLIKKHVSQPLTPSQGGSHVVNSKKATHPQRTT